MLFRSHPALNRKRSGVVVALIVRDVLTKYDVTRNAGYFRPVTETQTFRRDMGEVILPRHALRMDSRHAADVAVPREWWQTILCTHEVRLLEGPLLDLVGLNYGRRYGRARDWRQRGDQASDGLRLPLLAEREVAKGENKCGKWE